MLRSLAVRDFTIIDSLELELAPGFNAITGETGAGKSILVDALSLLLGDRADSTLVAEGRNQADLSATFELPEDHPARRWLVEQALEDDALLILRRVIPAEGASRAWINGQPATVGQLREIGALLVEIHGQHEHQRLTSPAWQRAWLDRHVEPEIRTRVADAAREADECRVALERLEAETGSKDESGHLRYQLEELERLAPGQGEYERLTVEQARLASVDELQRGFSEALTFLGGEELASASGLIQQARRTLEPLTDREPELKGLVEMIDTAGVNVEEAARGLQRLNESLENDPDRLAEVEQRLSRMIELGRKHNRPPEELPALTDELQTRLERIDGLETHVSEARSNLEQARRRWQAEAQKLHHARLKAAERIRRDTEQALSSLGMDAARVRFRIEHDPEAPVATHGADRVEILFSANPGRSVRPLGKVASGGELSRLSLAMIVATAEKADGRVRIFDEVDAGVGGETAHAVGRFLKQAGSDGQAFCVTHLAQVAARADSQLRVIKRSDDDGPRVAVETLDDKARIDELARMLGSVRSTTSREHAAALLEDLRE